MKTQEEIKQLTETLYPTVTMYTQPLRIGFEGGYTQCQQDVMKLLQLEIRRAYIHGQGNGQMIEVGLERDEIDDYINSRMKTLNKQDNEHI